MLHLIFMFCNLNRYNKFPQIFHMIEIYKIRYTLF